MAAELIHGLGKRSTRFTELDHARLQVVQRPLDQTVLLLVVGQKVMPKGVLDIRQRVALHAQD